MGEKSPIGSVLSTKPASSLEFYALELNKYAPHESPEYDYLPESFCLRSTVTKPGTMVVHQPDIPAPVPVNFPLPVWATRGEEVDDQDLDKQARESAGKF